ncbi:MAG: TRC40/GET3/ArsA family transport-energizing ATPase, partial [Halobacteriales archaeon]|nr:TRC40/GET3/ArsA family transport-energizing ATPase [Halobacteriales archaeon]
TDPAHSLSDIFETTIGADPTRIHDEHPLYAVEIDPDAAMADMTEAAEMGQFGGLGGLADLGGGAFGDLLGLDSEETDTGAAMPGADEAAAVQQLMRFLDDDRFDRVVIDTAPTGHTLRLLELPEVMDSMVGRILRFREKVSGMAAGITGLFSGDDEPDEEAVAADLQEVRRQIERLRDVLTDPTRTDFRIVMVPERLSVVESQRLRDRLGGRNIPVGTVVVNRVMEPISNIIDDPSVADVTEPDLEDCPFCQRRWAVQQGALQEAQDLFRGHDVRRVPLLADEVAGERMLRAVAACLA